MISLSLSYSSKFLTYGLLAVSQTRYMGRKAPKQGKPPILPPSKKVIMLKYLSIILLSLDVLYHVVHVPWQRPDEVKELLWRRHVYNNAVISLREVFRSEMQLKANEGQGLEAMKASEEAELDDLIAENDRINKEKVIFVYIILLILKSSLNVCATGWLEHFQTVPLNLFLKGLCNYFFYFYD
uniref:Small ribosomal subunit protein mS26 n=1 Tax=Heterorhabditis bacteriophora TaxID=37862 RepID=A0A1I7WXG0_HETBA